MTERDPFGRTDLHYAALEDDADRVTALLDEGELVSAEDVDGNTPLHLAAQEHAVGAARVLINGDASIDARNRWGNTPLFVATVNSAGRGGVIEMLLEAGADAAAVNEHGQTPIGLARLIANYDVAKFFPEHRVEP